MTLRAPSAPQFDSILAGEAVAGIPAEQLVEQFGSRLYVYDLGLVGRRIEALRAILPPRFRLAYAVKSNPALGVVSFVAGTGIGADVASGGELETVLRAGFAPERIVFTGPGKRNDELASAVAVGVGAVTVESPGELARLEAAAEHAGRRQRILLRLSVGDAARLERTQIIGNAGGAKFGMPLDVLTAAARRAAASPHLDLLGVHAFGASNLLDPDQLAGHVRSLAAAGREVAEATGVPLRLVDAGGGLGIAYETADLPLDLERLGTALAVIRSELDAAGLAETEILLEPGRFLVGPAGAYLATIVDVKGAADAPVVILDGGINHAVRPALVRQEHRLALLAPDAAERDLAPVTVAGPLCTGLDVFAVAATLPRPQVGDVVAVLDVGAYGFTESMPLFLSHGVPAEVAVLDGVARLIRPRISATELLERQIVPHW